MARNGFDTRELKKFRDNLVKLDKKYGQHNRGLC